MSLLETPRARQEVKRRSCREAAVALAAVESGSRRSRGCCAQPSYSTSDETSVRVRTRIYCVDRERAMATIGSQQWIGGEEDVESAVVKQGAGRGDGRQCGAGSGPITVRMIAYRGVLLGLVGKMFQGM